MFYAAYHSLLAIAARFGYESRNQQCTFALIRSLIEDGEIGLEQGTVDKIASMDTEKESERTGMEIRERYQYGTELSMEDTLYRETLELARKVLSKAKEIIEE